MVKNMNAIKHYIKGYWIAKLFGNHQLHLSLGATYINSLIALFYPLYVQSSSYSVVNIHWLCTVCFVLFLHPKVIYIVVTLGLQG